MSAHRLNPFAAVEQSINVGVAAMLANATAVFQGGEPFGVLFDRTAADPFGEGISDAASCTVSFCIANAPGIAQGGSLTIGGVPYVVSGPVQPDAGGWVTLNVYPGEGG